MALFNEQMQAWLSVSVLRSRGCPQHKHFNSLLEDIVVRDHVHQ